MKYLFISLIIIIFIGCNVTESKQKQDCIKVEAYKEYLNTETEWINYDHSAIHDTITADLICIIVDKLTMKSIPNAVVSFSKSHKSTNSSGICSFMGFNEGSYQLKISANGHKCVEINNLNFDSGRIRWLTVKLKKE